MRDFDYFWGMFVLMEGRSLPFFIAFIFFVSEIWISKHEKGGTSVSWVLAQLLIFLHSYMFPTMTTRSTERKLRITRVHNRIAIPFQKTRIIVYRMLEKKKKKQQNFFVKKPPDDAIKYVTVLQWISERYLKTFLYHCCKVSKLFYPYEKQIDL